MVIYHSFYNQCVESSVFTKENYVCWIKAWSRRKTWARLAGFWVYEAVQAESSVLIELFLRLNRGTNYVNRLPPALDWTILKGIPRRKLVSLALQTISPSWTICATGGRHEFLVTDIGYSLRGTSGRTAIFSDREIHFPMVGPQSEIAQCMFDKTECWS